MKKTKLLTAWLLGAVMAITPFTGAVVGTGVSVRAEEEYYEDEEGYEEETQEEYVFIQDPTVDSNDIKGWPQADPVDSDAAIVMDADTGTILYAKHIEEAKYPASITKIMTVLLALEHGNLEDTVSFSANAVYSIEYGSAHLGLTEGEELTLEQCLYGIMLASANEISNAVAEHIGGSVEGFAQMMNDKAKDLGCTNTHFVNPNGLHDADHYVCARDMALITREALKYEKFREIINTDEYHYPPTNLVDEDRYFVNHHAMLMNESYEGIIGGKTGYTDEAYNTLVTCAQREDMTLISVVLHAPGIESEYGDTQAILDYGFDNFQEISIVNSEQAQVNMSVVGVEDEEEIENIKTASLTDSVVSFDEETTKATIPNDAALSDLTSRFNVSKGVLSYFYNGERVARTTFDYTGDWPQTVNETEKEEDTQSDTAAQSEKEEQEKRAQNDTGILGVAVGVFDRITDFVTSIHNALQENDLLAVIVGAVLLLIFVPLLVLAIGRNRRYKKILRLRYKDMQTIKYLEKEIERKSAAQVEAELRARELEFALESERRKNQDKAAANKEEKE